MVNFIDKTILITGGTGSFGRAFLNRIKEGSFSEIRIFSRDEKKQDDMRKEYSNLPIKFYIGDVRDADSVKSAVKGVDYIFHAAALKQVPSCEFYPIEAVKTNILGTDNLLKEAIQEEVSKVICLSTDKAVYPINAMGLTKSLMEKVLISRSREGGSKTIISGTRYGNVMGSRGSVIPLFIKQIKEGSNITITNRTMTRFIMSLKEAVELVLFAFDNGKNGDIFVQKSPACSIIDLASALMTLYDANDQVIQDIGIRHGEKLYETLVSAEEMNVAEDLGKFYKISSDNRDLNYGNYFDCGNVTFEHEEYNSNNTHQLSIDEIIKILKDEGFSK